MPSSPQTITTRGVFDYLYNSAGKAIVGATVNCTLNFNGASVTSPIVNLGELQQSTVTDQNGFWRFNLVPNDTITPTGTLYTIQAGNITSYDISVPSGGADVQSSSILANTPSVLSPAATGLTGPITVTGNETVTGNLTVSGTTTLGSTTTGALTTAAETVGGDLTISSAFRLLFGAAAAKIIPGATSISHRNNADNADNLLITDAGAVTVRNGLTVTAGGETVTAGDLVVTAGRLLVSAAAAKILGGVTSLSLRNNADSADNLLITDAGLATLRNALSIPPAAGGTLPTTAFGTLPVKFDEQSINGVATFNFATVPTWARVVEIRWLARSTNASNNVAIQARFNADATASYDRSRATLDSTYASGGASNGTTGDFADIPGASSSATSWATGTFTLLYPNLTGFERNAHAVTNRHDAGITGGVVPQIGTVSWRNTTNAITTITFLLSAGNFNTSVFEAFAYP